MEAALGCITEADAARWALEFASASFGDALLASAVAILLLPEMPRGVQVSLIGCVAESSEFSKQAATPLGP